MNARGLLLSLVVVLSFPVNSAFTLQGTCPAVVAEALEATDAGCSFTRRNEICYGHVSLTALPLEDAVENFHFEAQGDIIPLDTIQHVSLSPLDVQTERWGIALLRLQAALTDTLPGQNVTVLLFGDVEFRPVLEDEGPVRAFYFSTGLAGAACAEVPESGMLIRTPEDSQGVALRINDVDVRLASTAYLQAPRQDALIIHLLEGAAEVAAFNVTRAVEAGHRVSVPINDEAAAAGAPGIPEPFDPAIVQALPLWLLEAPAVVRQCSEGDTLQAPAARHSVFIASDGLHFPESLDAFAFGVRLDGEALPPVSGLYLWPEADDYHIQQRFGAGALEPGTHTVAFVGSVSRRIEDPSRQAWGPAAWSNTCTLIVGED